MSITRRLLHRSIGLLAIYPHAHLEQVHRHPHPVHPVHVPPVHAQLGLQRLQVLLLDVLLEHHKVERLGGYVVSPVQILAHHPH